MTMIVIGVDCGLSGALAMINQDGLAAVHDMPVMAKGAGHGRVKNEVNGAALNALLKNWVDGVADDVLVVIERVASRPGQGVAGMMSIGDSVGCIRGVVAARGYPVQWVTPQRWKKYFGLPADKEFARARAIQLYPSAPLERKKDHGRAEAILISLYGWQVLKLEDK